MVRLERGWAKASPFKSASLNIFLIIILNQQRTSKKYKTMSIIHFIAAICIFGGSITTAQTLTYTVYVAGKKSGTLVVKSNKTDNENFFIHSEANIAVALSEVNSVSDVYFKNGHLHHSSVIQTINAKEREKTTITYDGTHYYIQRKGEERKSLKNSVLYSIAMMYHTEPTGQKTAFSERYGTFLNIKKLSQHQYQLELPDGKINTYTYENGICTQVQTRQLMMEVRFELLGKKGA